MKRWTLVAAALTAAACASLAPILNSQVKHKAPHTRHAAAEVDCLTCHETIFDSTSVEQRDLPKEKTCLGCHKKEKADCGFCHTDANKPQTFPVRLRNVRMDHSKHLERTNEDCKVCHKKLPDPYWSEDVKPPMSACLSCHEHQEEYDRGACTGCHKDMTRYALKPVATFKHGQDFLKQHAKDARSSPNACSQCHDQSFCSECHAKTVDRRIELVSPERADRNFVHRHDFLGRHPLEAKADPMMCARCHGQDFCQECHQKNGLIPGDNTRDPHPAGFATTHGPAARSDIARCATCHDQGAATNCVQCHRVGGTGGNPHPPSWLLRHTQEEIARDAMCQVCHR